MRMNSGQYPSPPGMIITYYNVPYSIYMIFSFARILPLPTKGCGEGEESTVIVMTARGAAHRQPRVARVGFLDAVGGKKPQGVDREVLKVFFHELVVLESWLVILPCGNSVVRVMVGHRPTITKKSVTMVY